MPNWCNNTMAIQGDPESITDFLQRVHTVNDEGHDTYDIIGRLYPIPTELKDTKSGHYTAEPHPNWKVSLDNGDITQEWYDELVSSNATGYAQGQANLAKYGARDWYDWCCSHWGTKWGDCDTSLNGHSDTHLDFSFDTAWSPPIDALNHISTMFPTLEFHIQYEELGNGLIGAGRIQNGLVATCDGSVEDIEGYADLDWNDEDFDWQAYQDKVDDLKSKCESEVMGEVGEPLAHPDKNILVMFEAIRQGVRTTASN